MPTFSYPVNATIVVVAPVGADIHYTLDTSTPDATDPIYTAPILITATTTIKAIGIYPGYVNSLIATNLVIIGTGNFYGYSSLTTLTGVQVIAITNAPLPNTFVSADSLGTYTFGASSTVSDYFYFWWPDSFTVPRATDGFELVASGFPVPMAGVAQGFTNGPSNGWYYKNLTVDGTPGKLYRTYYQVGSGAAQQILVQ